jgi:hypothetical protein
MTFRFQHKPSPFSCGTLADPPDILSIYPGRTDQSLLLSAPPSAASR